MLTFYVIINTYNRQNKAKLLYSQLKKEFKTAGIDDYLIHFYNDGGDKYNWEDNHLMTTYTPHHGKDRYYELVQMEIRNRKKAEYYLKLDDDVQLVPGFFEKLLEAWNSITDPMKMTLNPLKDHRKDMWGGVPQRYNKYVDETDWVDLIFLANERFMETMSEFTLKKKPAHIQSSGVGRQITRHLRGVEIEDKPSGIQVIRRGDRLGKMYQVRESLLLHGNHESKMNPDRMEKLTDI